MLVLYVLCYVGLVLWFFLVSWVEFFGLLGVWSGLELLLVYSTVH